MELCSDADMTSLVQIIEREEVTGLAELRHVLVRFPQDPRLHFMLGSILAGQKQLIDAHAALSRAVEIAPDFHIARYQLGFFELTSGEVDRALSTWGPLLRLPENAYLRVFTEGLTHLLRDEFSKAIEMMRAGIALNQDNEPLNNDIRLMIAKCEEIIAKAASTTVSGDDGQEKSATSILLGQFTGSPTQH